jgi:hypothetical protein
MLAICDGFSHVVSNKSTMRVSRKTSYLCVRDKGSLPPLLLRGHTRAGKITAYNASFNNQCSFPKVSKNRYTIITACRLV